MIVTGNANLSFTLSIDTCHFWTGPQKINLEKTAASIDRAGANPVQAPTCSHVFIDAALVAQKGALPGATGLRLITPKIPPSYQTTPPWANPGSLF